MTGPAIVADTTSYLPTELTERHGVQLVSLYVGIDGKQERESALKRPIIEMVYMPKARFGSGLPASRGGEI